MVRIYSRMKRSKLNKINGLSEGIEFIYPLPEFRGWNPAESPLLELCQKYKRVPQVHELSNYKRALKEKIKDLQSCSRKQFILKYLGKDPGRDLGYFRDLYQGELAFVNHVIMRSLYRDITLIKQSQ